MTFCNAQCIMGMVSQYIDYVYCMSDFVIIEDKQLEFSSNEPRHEISNNLTF